MVEQTPSSRRAATCQMLRAALRGQVIQMRIAVAVHFQPRDLGAERGANGVDRHPCGRHQQRSQPPECREAAAQVVARAGIALPGKHHADPMIVIGGEPILVGIALIIPKDEFDARCDQRPRDRPGIFLVPAHGRILVALAEIRNSFRLPRPSIDSLIGPEAENPPSPGGPPPGAKEGITG